MLSLSCVRLGRGGWAALWAAVWMSTALAGAGALGQEAAGGLPAAGTVRAQVARPAAHEDAATTAALMAAYAPADVDEFNWTLQPLSATGGAYRVYDVRFPTARPGRYEANNTVVLEYYHAAGDGVRPAVVVLDIQAGNMAVARLVAGALAGAGVDAAIMYLPLYGPRRPSAEEEQKLEARSLQMLTESVPQAVWDVRRTARWLAAQPWIDADRIGLQGSSLGAIVGSLAAGVDGAFPRVCLLLGGGDLATILTTGQREVIPFGRDAERQGLDRAALARLLRGIEPLNFARRLRAGQVLMINGRTDPIVPPACSEKLAEASGARVVWYDTDHYGLLKWLLPVLAQVTEFFPPQGQW